MTVLGARTCLCILGRGRLDESISDVPNFGDVSIMVREESNGMLTCIAPETFKPRTQRHMTPIYNLAFVCAFFSTGSILVACVQYVISQYTYSAQ